MWSVLRLAVVNRDIHPLVCCSAGHIVLYCSILPLQVSDEDKRGWGDFIICTDKDTNFTRVEVAELVHRLLAACG